MNHTDQQPIKRDAIQPEMVLVLAAKTEAERLRIAWGMWRSARKMIQRIVASENAGMTSEDQEKIVSSRISHGT
jgi:hypothetical protein